MNGERKPTKAQASPGPGHFPLVRYFSVVSLVSTVITALALGWGYRQHEVGELREQAERESAAFARVLSFTLRDEVATLLQPSRAEGLTPGASERIAQVVKIHAKYFGASKVKIYAGDGTTIFSTYPAEIGRNQAGNPGVTGALRGAIKSNLVYREQFNAFDRVIENRNLLQTYLPVEGPQAGEVIGVFELYSDITDLLARIRAAERVVTGSVAGTLLLLYGVLFVFVLRADRIIKRQAEALQDQLREINLHNLQLEDRVRERTGALEGANRKLVAEIGEREAAQRELEQARQRASQQDKLAAIGRLAAGIVHEIGNPLAAVGGLAETAQEDLANQQLQSVDQSLLLIRDHIRRLETITRDVSGFAVPETREAEPLNLNELVHRVIKVMRYDAKLKHVRFELDLDHDLAAVSAIPDQIWQVLMNLVLNAADAIERKEGVEPTIHLTTSRRGEFAVLAVADRGGGMSEEAVAKAFEPFHTTKAPGEGMGIGLSLCYAIIRSHGGDISIASSPGEGTTVSATLPLADVAGL